MNEQETKRKKKQHIEKERAPLRLDTSMPKRYLPRPVESPAARAATHLPAQHDRAANAGCRGFAHSAQSYQKSACPHKHDILVAQRLTSRE